VTSNALLLEADSETNDEYLGEQTVVLKSLTLRNFRGFRNFSLSLGETTYLVGPNNAGKSTILNSLRVMETQLRVAMVKSPSLHVADGDLGSLLAYPASMDDFASLSQSARFDFGLAEARVTVKWDSKVHCCLRWPELSDATDVQTPHLYLRYDDGGQPRRPTDVNRYYSLLGVVPTLGPVDNQESLLTSQKYVKSNIAGRLSSRHFRNQLWLLKESGAFQEYLDFANAWTTEIKLVDVVRTGADLDVYYREGRRRRERELAWAGDGLQVWLQILYHIHRTRDLPTIILDEPEVFLHPDLQRRLVRLLEESKRQVIVATHSSELVSEVAPRSVVLIDRSLNRARRIKDASGLSALSDQIGSRFNLSLARALKANVAVFIEGQDAKLLTRSARVLGMESIATEHNIAFIPMGGFDGHQHVDAFDWLCKDLLKDSVRPYVLLDRDYKADSIISEVEKKFANLRIAHHVWRQKELESYYLDVGTMSRISGLSRADICSILVSVTDAMRSRVHSRLATGRIDAELGAKRDRNSILEDFDDEFDAAWTDLSYRLARGPAKDILAGLNQALQELGKKALSFDSIASRQLPSDVHAEMYEMLAKIEAMASS
jgi:energy-coupling factor transporter ATP-binding protein EcfA2